MRFIQQAEVLSVFVDSSIYNEDVLHKCFYWYGGDFEIVITRNLASENEVHLKPKDVAKADYPKIVSKIKQDLIDFKLRDIVTKETKVIRELLIAKAFAYYDIEELPSTQISDPVGFDPLSIQGND